MPDGFRMHSHWPSNIPSEEACINLWLAQKMDEANKDVSQKYKLKCILRNKRIDHLPTFAKEIKLAYLGTTDKNSSHLPMNSVSNDE